MSAKRAAVLPSLSPLTPAQRELAAKWVPLTQGLATKLGKTPQERRDLFAEFQVPLMRCAVRFDPGRGLTFQALLTRACYNAMISYHRRLQSRAEVRLVDAHHDRAPAMPPQRKKPDADQQQEREPTAHDRAREEAIIALRDGCLYRVARDRAAKHAPVSLRQVYRWAQCAGVRRQKGRRRLLDSVPEGDYRQVAAQCGVHHATVFRIRKIVTSDKPPKTVAACVDVGNMSQQSTPIASRVRAAAAAQGRKMCTLAADLDISPAYLHKLLSSGAWTPVHIKNLKRALGDQAWRYVCGETRILG
jgi:DNA-directed RNA polymerase specialized sigma24 family protein